MHSGAYEHAIQNDATYMGLRSSSLGGAVASIGAQYAIKRHQRSHP